MAQAAKPSAFSSDFADSQCDGSAASCVSAREERNRCCRYRRLSQLNSVEPQASDCVAMNDHERAAESVLTLDRLGAQAGAETQTDPLWYKDAIIYQLHVKAFFDSNNDGIGDFVGLTQKLDYIQDLGVNAIWLLPFYPSPLRDDGYDISDYCDVHPDYGTLDDFRHFVEEAHRRGLKVITELVINHTSDQHPWFQRARRAPRG